LNHNFVTKTTKLIRITVTFNNLSSVMKILLSLIVY